MRMGRNVLAFLAHARASFAHLVLVCRILHRRALLRALRLLLRAARLLLTVASLVTLAAALLTAARLLLLRPALLLLWPALLLLVMTRLLFALRGRAARLKAGDHALLDFPVHQALDGGHQRPILVADQRDRFAFRARAAGAADAM